MNLIEALKLTKESGGRLVKDSWTTGTRGAGCGETD